MSASNAQTSPKEIAAFLEEASSLNLNPVGEDKIRRGRRLGKGSFSIVSEAAVCVAGKSTVVAIKELRSERVAFHKLKAQLLSEASVLAKLNHKHIVRYIGCGVSMHSGGRASPFMLQRYLAGGSLDEYLSRLKRRRTSHDARFSYSLETALRWAMQVTSAIGYLHSCEVGVVHRDIKLANLLLTEKYVEAADVKLADFGLSIDMTKIKPVANTNVTISPAKLDILSRRTLKALSPLLASSQAVETIAAMECIPWGVISKRNLESKRKQSADHSYYDLTEETGSYMYMSPEVWLGLPYNEKADIYSLGVLICEILTATPFSSCLLPQKSYEEAKNFSFCVANGLRLTCPSHFPKPLASILNACWNQDPVLRPTALQVSEGLSSFAASVRNASNKPLFHPMRLTKAQQLKLGFARFRHMSDK